jgi:23S rRNA (cytosine1962-C5)-methyltransferase
MPISQIKNDYELIDSGEGEKLERFGDIVLSRPDPQALWHKSLESGIWKKAQGTFSRDGNNGKWNIKPSTPNRWSIEYGNLKFWIRPTAFKHVGLFPEQIENWDWMRKIVGESKEKDIEVLNLFGYTGGATLACSQAGAKVVHIDGSKVAINWARENAELSGLGTNPIRWILDDARTFVKREIKRGRKYHGIIMDPPAFGHGPEGELWNIEKDFLDLLDLCEQILVDNPLFIVVNGYSAGYSAYAYKNVLLPIQKKFGGKIEQGELLLRESNNKDRKTGSRDLPCGIYARWSSR